MEELGEEVIMKEAINKANRGFRRFLPRDFCERGKAAIDNMIQNNEPITLAGFCVQIGIPISAFKSLCEKPKETNLYVLPANLFAAFIAYFYERHGISARNPIFPIFMMKNLGFEDRQISEVKQVFDVKERNQVRDRLKKLK